MEDKDILTYFCGKKLKNIQHKKLNNIPQEYQEYLKNRYNNFVSYRETIIRIIQHIDIVPKCPICGKDNQIHKYKSIYLSTCGNKDCIEKYRKQKYENTMLLVHGYKYNYQNKDILDKSINNSLSEQSKQKHKLTCLERYGNENYTNRDKAVKNTNYNLVINKSKKTKLKKYGNENYNNFEKSKQTKLERYGNEYYTNQEKRKLICLKRYGVECLFQNDLFQKQIHDKQIQKYGCLAFNTNKQKETNLKKYGHINPFGSKEIQQKIKKSRINHFGKYQSDLQIIKSHSEDANIKRYITKKKNGTFNTSKPEEESYLLLKEKYPDVIRQYRSELYPFNCDFYIPSKNLYIECNYTWTHGGKLYEGTEDDNIKLNKWKEKNTKYYDQAIYTWTDLDVRKRNIANQNNLNYKIFYNIDELKIYIEEQ